MSTRYRDLNSPIGHIRLVAEGEFFSQLQLPFKRQKGHLHALTQAPSEWRHEPMLLNGLTEQLTAYFNAELRDFEWQQFGLPRRFTGTPFQQQVWLGLERIAYGQTCSYGALAQAIGRPAAVRAVGAANGANPFAILIPCHRVIAADGSLHGYGGGLSIKQQLLTLEQALLS